jgi:enolase-phosphatase E1
MIRAIVTDIEGTTSSLSFVKDVLFPYARERVGDFVRARRGDPAVQAQLAEVRRLAGGHLDEAAVIAQLERWIDEDKKITPLKTLQGMIWEDGYRRGDFTGHIYDDAVRALRAWHDRGVRLYVYSSGSVLAQKLLFAHTAYGDLTPLFAGYFDTILGGKREPDSYRRIAQHIELPPGDILFLSDVWEELDAAQAAGMQTTWVLRDAQGSACAAGGTSKGNEVGQSKERLPLTTVAGHPQVPHFDGIVVEH